MAGESQPLRNLIDGDPVAGDGEDRMAVLNPATGQELWNAPVSEVEDVDRAVAAARRAFAGWSARTPAERSQALLAMAAMLEQHGEELARLEALNAGKPILAVSRDELPVMADNLRFFAGAARCMEGRAAGEYMQGYTSFTRREAIGVIGQITPWNYPLMMAIWKIAPALAAGNTIVLKPAETTPVTTVRFAELAADVLPMGVLNVVMGPGRPTGQALLEHPDVDMISLTGSVGTGKHVARTAAETLKRVHLELGGKAPVIVFDDVDMDSAMETIAATGYYNAGQDCTAATRVLAGPKVYDDVVNGLAEQAQALVVGDTLSPDTTFGPLNSCASEAGSSAFLTAAQGTPNWSQVDTPPSARASIWNRPSSPAWSRATSWCAMRSSDRSSPCSASPMRPRRSSGPTPRVMALPHRCGPVTWAGPCVCRRRLRFGCVWINDHIPLVSEMPHGGFKDSGYGKDLSVYSLEDYTVVKHVMARSSRPMGGVSRPYSIVCRT